MKIKINVEFTETEGKEIVESADASAVIKEISETINASIKQYKAKNPDVDVEAILNKEVELLPVFRGLSSREVDKFVAKAKEQGTNMPFDSMEMGILAAGRKDMQDGLTEILNSLKFSKPTCQECAEELDNSGRSKKKY